MSRTYGKERGRPTTFLSAWIRAGLGTAYTLLAALPSRAARSRVIRLAREFGYDHRVGPVPALPQVDIDEVVTAAAIRIREPLAADGNVTLLELIVLSALVVSRQPRRLFEIGTFDGRTTLNLAANAPADAMVYTLDLPEKAEPFLAVHSDDEPFIARSRAGGRGHRFRNAPEAVKIVQLEGDSATYDYSRLAGTVDFVFVDGAHSREYVLSDSRAALGLAARGGLIAWHDYGEWPGVTSALDTLRATDPRFAGLRHVQETTLALLEV